MPVFQHVIGTVKHRKIKTEEEINEKKLTDTNIGEQNWGNSNVSLLVLQRHRKETFPSACAYAYTQRTCRKGKILIFSRNHFGCL